MGSEWLFSVEALRSLGLCTSSNRFMTKLTGVSVLLESVWRCQLQSFNTVLLPMRQPLYPGSSLSPWNFPNTNVRETKAKIAVMSDAHR